jgi:hypothetical protein
MGRKRTCDQDTVLDAFARKLTLAQISRSMGGVPIGTLGAIIHRARKAGDPRAALRRRPALRPVPDADVAPPPISAKRRRQQLAREFPGSVSELNDAIRKQPSNHAACGQASRHGAGDRPGCEPDRQYPTRGSNVIFLNSQWSLEASKGPRMPRHRPSETPRLSRQRIEEICRALVASTNPDGSPVLCRPLTPFERRQLATHAAELSAAQAQITAVLGAAPTEAHVRARAEGLFGRKPHPIPGAVRSRTEEK